MSHYSCTEPLATGLHTVPNVYRTWLQHTFLTYGPGPALTTLLVTQTVRGTTVAHPRQGPKRRGHRRNGDTRAVAPSDRSTRSTPPSVTARSPQRHRVRDAPTHVLKSPHSRGESRSSVADGSGTVPAVGRFLPNALRPSRATEPADQIGSSEHHGGTYLRPGLRAARGEGERGRACGGRRRRRRTAESCPAPRPHCFPQGA